MTHLFEPPSHSEYIARWRLYLWIYFLETEDDSQFIIPEDRKMAKKAKDKINRMEVMAYVESLFPATGYPIDNVKDSMNLTKITDSLFKINDKTNKFAEKIKQVKKLDCYLKLMKDAKSPIKVRSYSYVNHSDEIVVVANGAEPSFSGADLLKLFDGKVRVYEGKRVIAKNDPSGYCCLYFENGKGKSIPITGADAKVIGAAILADLAAEQLKQSKSEEVYLVQGYTSEGNKDDIAEYYSDTAKRNLNVKDKAFPTSSEALIKVILSPLVRLYNEPKLADLLRIQIKTLLDLLTKELTSDSELKSNASKHAKTVQYYTNTIKKLLIEARDRHVLDKIRIPKDKKRNNPSANQFYSMIEPALSDINSYRMINSTTGKPYLYDNINHIKGLINNFNKLSHQKEISITIQNDDGTENKDPKSIPNYFIIATTDGSPYVLDFGMDSDSKVTLPLQNNGPKYHCIELESSWHTLSSDERIKPTGVLAADMNETATFISSRGEQIVPGSLRRYVTAEDVDIIAKSISKKISESIDNVRQPLNLDTIRKLGYTCTYALYFQAGMQSGYILPLSSAGSPNATLSPGNLNQKFISMSVDKNGNACITMTSVTHLKEVLGNTYLDESLAIRTEIRVNIYDKNPVFTMKQMAELKNVPELRPEYFFNEKPKPRPSLWGRYFGYTNCTS